MVLAVPIAATLLNSRFFLIYNHRPRIYAVVWGFVLAYILLIYSYLYPHKSLQNLRILCGVVVISSISSSIGEAAILGYLKVIPYEMIFRYNTGKMLGIAVGTFSASIFIIYGIEMIVFFFPLVLTLGLYVICFDWIDFYRLTHK